MHSSKTTNREVTGIYCILMHPISYTCIDVNECEDAAAQERDLCEERGLPNGGCINTPGDFLCQCRDGYMEVPVSDGPEFICEGELIENT